MRSRSGWQADQPAYWRLTSLDRFDGQVWSSSGSFSEADGRLPGVPPGRHHPCRYARPSPSSPCATIWAPAALTPVELDDADTELRWNGELATLIVPAAERLDRRGRPTRSPPRCPSSTPEDLEAPRARRPRRGPGATPPACPPTLPAVVARQARQVVDRVGPRPLRPGPAPCRTGSAAPSPTTSRAPTPATTRGPSSASSRPGGATASSSPAPSRPWPAASGIPARVAVGFTPGEVDEDGTHLHRAGPQRPRLARGPHPGGGLGALRAHAGTGPARHRGLHRRGPGRRTTADRRPRRRPPRRRPRPPRPPPTAPRRDDLGPAIGPGRHPHRRRRAPGAPRRPRPSWAACVPGRPGRGRRRRRHPGAWCGPGADGGAGPRPASAGRVRAAWAEAVDALTRAGVGAPPAETDREFAARAAPTLGDDGAALVRPGRAGHHRDLGPDGRTAPIPGVADRAVELSRRVDGPGPSRHGPGASDCGRCSTPVPCSPPAAARPRAGPGPR